MTERDLQTKKKTNGALETEITSKQGEKKEVTDQRNGKERQRRN